MLLRQSPAHDAAGFLRNAAGVRLAVSSDFDASGERPRPTPGEGVLFDRLGAALVHGDPEQAQALADRALRHSLLIAPERYTRASELAVASPAARAGGAGCGSSAVPLIDTSLATWGLEATRIRSSRFSGRGTRVAILDTGLDLRHPDFADRTIVSQSFVAGLAADDANGHGTFCAGVACGPLHAAQGPRYGIAFGAELYIARVLDDSAGGTDGDTLAGIDWAVRSHCEVISMSLGSPVALGDSHPRVYEAVAARALAAGSLLIAPAGNTSQRPDTIAPVEHPANCPSILAVGAVDHSLAVAPFSNGALNPNGGEVDVAAPGIAIFSAAPRPDLYQTGSGTSMAASYVAGIAALFAEADLTARGAALRALLRQACRALSSPMRDIGAGLVQAPQ